MTSPQIPVTGFVENLDEDVYHDLDHVSSHGIKAVLRSPEHFFHKYVLKNRDDKASKAMELGKKVHAAFLEPKRFNEMKVVMPDFGAMQSSTNRKKRDEWIAVLPSGSIILKQEEVDQILGMAEAIRRHKIAAPILEQIAGEVSGFWVDEFTQVSCRMRIDGLIMSKKLIVDYKTAEDASPQAFSSAAARYGYDVQAGHYVMGTENITKERFDYCFIAQETSEPYSPAVYIPDHYFVEAGMSLAKKGLLKIKECRETNLWPGYSEEALNMSLPMWRMMQVESA